MECHKCPEYMKHKGEAWENTPCKTCQLKHDSHGTFEYSEGRIENASWDGSLDDEKWTREAADDHTAQPYSRLTGERLEEINLPLSTLVSAMGLFLSLSLPARKTMQLRMKNVPYSEIGRRLGCTRQAVEKLLAQALAKQPLLQNLLPTKTAREPTPLTATRTSVIADYDKSAKKRVTASRKPPFVPISETRTA